MDDAVEHHAGHFLEVAHPVLRPAELALVVLRRGVERGQHLLQLVDVAADRAGRLGDLVVLAVDFADHLADADQRVLDPRDRIARLVAHLHALADLDDHLLGFHAERVDRARDLVGRLAGLAGERLDLGGDDREAAARVARARRLDRRVEREDVGGLGDLVDVARALRAPGSSPRRSR